MKNDITMDLDSLDITVTVKTKNGEIEEFNIKDELMIDRDNVNEGYINQPGRYAWWGMVLEVAKANVERAKRELSVQEAEADERVRTELDMEGVKITEAIVTRRLKADKGYLKASDELAEAQKAAGILDKVLKAFDQRMEALISLGANLRKEEVNVELTMKKMKAREVLKKNK